MVDVFSLFQRDERISPPPHSLHVSDYLFHQFSPDESARDHGLVDHDRSVVFEARKNVFGERCRREREREKDEIRLHQKGNKMYLPDGIIRENQNNPEKRPVFHAERRNEEGEEHGEEGGVHRSHAVRVAVVVERGVSRYLSRFVVRAQNAGFYTAKIEPFV